MLQECLGCGNLNKAVGKARSRQRDHFSGPMPACLMTRLQISTSALRNAPTPFYRIYRFELASDVARSTPTNVDRVSKVSLKATGAKIAPLFDGSQQLIAVTSVPWYSRQVSLPGS
jgi:hypothetical protein